MSQDFILIRTSDYRSFKPIDLENVRVENDLGEWWLDEEEKKRNVITLQTLDDLLNLVEKFDKVVIIPKDSKSLVESTKYPTIEIYDFYRE